MKFKKVLAIVMAMAMMVTAFTGCSNDTTKSEDVLNTGVYEGFGMKFSYEPDFWVNLYNNPGSEASTSSVALYDEETENVTEVGRIDASVTDLETAKAFVNGELEYFKTLGTVSDDVLTEGEDNVKLTFKLTPMLLPEVEPATGNEAEEENVLLIAPAPNGEETIEGEVEGEVVEDVPEVSETPETSEAVEGNVEENPEEPVDNSFMLVLYAKFTEGKSAYVFFRTPTTQYEETSKQVDKIIKSLTWSEIEEPGEVHDMTEVLYDYDIKTKDIEGFEVLKNAEYTDDNGVVHTAIVVPSDNEKAVYTYEDTMSAVTDGLAIYHYTLPLDSYSTAADVVTSMVGDWYDMMTQDGSNFRSSSVTMDYKALDLNADEVFYVMGYAFTQASYQTDENGEYVVDENGKYILEEEPTVIDTYLDVFRVAKTEAGYEYTNIEATGSELTEKGEAAIREIAELYKLNLTGDQLVNVFSEFTTPVVETPVVEEVAE